MCKSLAHHELMCLFLIQFSLHGSSALFLNLHLHHHASVYKTVASILLIATLHSGLYYIILCSLQQTWLPDTYWFMILSGLCSVSHRASSLPYHFLISAFPRFHISYFLISHFSFYTDPNKSCSTRGITVKWMDREAGLDNVNKNSELKLACPLSGTHTSISRRRGLEV